MKIPKGDFDATGPCWVQMTDQVGAPSKPIVVCRCGSYFGLGLHHVRADGRVTASFYHAETMTPPGCGFHEFSELDGYDGPEFLPRAT